MRIIGEIPHPLLKITIFKLDNRFSVKFEAGLYEQVYKFRMSSSLNNFTNIKEMIDEIFITSVINIFAKMHTTKNSTLTKKNLDTNAEFENII